MRFALEALHRGRARRADRRGPGVLPVAGGRPWARRLRGAGGGPDEKKPAPRAVRSATPRRDGRGRRRTRPGPRLPARRRPSPGASTWGIHGGGFYMGTAAQGDERHRALADALRIAVIGVDYRLAPEHPWPAAPDDCEAVALWLIEQAETRFGTTRLAIGGSSAGATLALATLLRLRDRGVADRFAGGRAALRHLRSERAHPERPPHRGRVLHPGVRRPRAGRRPRPSRSRPSTPTSPACPRRCSSWAPRTSCWRTT
ncbi:Acetyl esterase [Streptomyces badius]